ncbi:class I glutamine amidotransferase-like protein [Chaetomium sp. MPI-SDFR-AT-0129]|nr:class I glutamine amidotransferase-like protein [Chaetomium sp. MPI-SDFR-AT-0129]
MIATNRSTKLFTRALALLLLITPTLAGVIPSTRSANTPGDDEPLPRNPRRIGFLLPRSFDVIDVFGPLDILQAVSRKTHLELVLLARTLDPVDTAPVSAGMNPFNSTFFPRIVPTHTYADKPQLDVLFVPGGAAARNPDLEPEFAYLREAFPELQYFVTICTGAGIAAQAGVLDGHRATTNKAAWTSMTPKGPNVKWVSPARWVEDGKVWSSSGVTAGMDLTFEFVRQKYDDGENLVKTISGSIEHTVITDWRDDPWAAYYNVPVTN